MATNCSNWRKRTSYGNASCSQFRKNANEDAGIRGFVRPTILRPFIHYIIDRFGVCIVKREDGLDGCSFKINGYSDFVVEKGL
jgi:hypothetical protein